MTCTARSGLFIAWLSDAGRVRGRSGLSDRCDLHFQTTLSCPVLRDHYNQWLRSLTGHYTDFWQTTEEGLMFAAATLKLEPMKRPPSAYDSPQQCFHNRRRALVSGGSPLDASTIA